MKVVYLGNGSQDDVQKRLQKVASAAKISRTSGKANEVYESCGKFDSLGYEKAISKVEENGGSKKDVNKNKYEPFQKNLNFAKRVINMGHGSISEHDYIMLSIDDVSPIVEHTLINSRLSSFTIKSRREVDFRTNGFYVPNFRDKDGNIHPDNERLKEIFINHEKNLFEEYGHLVDSGMKLEEARYVLPYSFYSNLFMGMDARTFTQLTKELLYGKESNIEELRKLGEEFLKIIDEKIPYMSDEVRKNPPNKEDDFAYLDDFAKKKHISFDTEIHDGVSLVSSTPNADDVVLASVLQKRYQISQDKALKLLEKCSADDPLFKENLMKKIFASSDQRALEQASFKFDIPIPLAVRTHLERHRMQSLSTPDFVPLWSLENYVKPHILTKEQKEVYDRIFQKNREVRDYFQSCGVNDNDLVYFYQAANICNVLTSVNARSLAWMSRMRCCNKAQPAIRKVVNGMCDETRKVAPLIGEGLGATCDVFGYCNEGKESCGKVLAKRREGQK